VITGVSARVRSGSGPALVKSRHHSRQCARRLRVRYCAPLAAQSAIA
jgi:hypothetical protein